MTIQCCGFLERTDRTSNSCGKTACFGCLDAFCPLVFFKWRCRTTTHAGRRFAVRCKRRCGLVPTENRAGALRPSMAKKRQKNRQTTAVLSAIRASPGCHRQPAAGNRQPAVGQAKPRKASEMLPTHAQHALPGSSHSLQDTVRPRVLHQRTRGRGALAHRANEDRPHHQAITLHTLNERPFRFRSQAGSNQRVSTTRWPE